MKILLTGASSFTGAWFARTLASRGHSVSATLQGSPSSYSALRCNRIAFMQEAGVELVSACSFGSDSFMDIISQGYDILCHHAADVTDYKSADFNISAALAANTHNIRAVIAHGKATGLSQIIVTGSVFEQDEGAGELPLAAFSPYGLSKAFSWQMIAYYAAEAGLSAGKFVIPNPFGKYEEPRFCAHLMRVWASGATAEVKTPAYVRDNIPVDKLAMAYAQYLESRILGKAASKINPSGYIESQGAFAMRFGREIGMRLGLQTPLALLEQTEFAEPSMRVNIDRVCPDWNENLFWDDLSQYYKTTYLSDQ